MAKVYLSKTQHAKLKQNSLYRLIKIKKGEKDISGTKLANACGETKQKFKYRFDNQLLEPWELMVVFDELGICGNDLKIFEIGD